MKRMPEAACFRIAAQWVIAPSTTWSGEFAFAVWTDKQQLLLGRTDWVSAQYFHSAGNSRLRVDAEGLLARNVRTLRREFMAEQLHDAQIGSRSFQNIERVAGALVRVYRDETPIIWRLRAVFVARDPQTIRRLRSVLAGGRRGARRGDAVD